MPGNGQKKSHEPGLHTSHLQLSCDVKAWRRGGVEAWRRGGVKALPSALGPPRAVARQQRQSCQRPSQQPQAFGSFGFL